MMQCGLNLLALAVFTLLNRSALRLCRQDASAAKRTVRKLCWLLLGGNLLRYLVIYPVFDHVIKIPAEFSTVAYFVVPLILLMGWTQLHSWAAYSGLMAGFFYYVAMILAGQTIYGSDPINDVLISMLCHGTLYFCGVVMITAERCARQQRGLLLLGVCYVALRAAVLRPLIPGRGRMLIYILLDAVPVQMLFPEELWYILIPIYYVLILLFILWSIAGFYRRSEVQYRKFRAPRMA